MGNRARKKWKNYKLLQNIGKPWSPFKQGARRCRLTGDVAWVAGWATCEKSTNQISSFAISSEGRGKPKEKATKEHNGRGYPGGNIQGS